jgi:GntR family transcriptional regulator
MQLTIHPSDDRPIYRQIVGQITDAVAAGRLRPGDKVDSHRELALKLTVAPLTVKKAYDELEKEGILESRRGRGTFVAERAPAPDREAGRERLREEAHRLLTRAKLVGVPHREVLRLLAEVRKEMES